MSERAVGGSLAIALVGLLAIILKEINGQNVNGGTNLRTSQINSINATNTSINTYTGARSNSTRKLSKSRRVPKGNGTYHCDDDLSLAIEKCAKPLMSIIEGTIEKWPKNEEDAFELCKSFAVAEKCIKDVARKCAQGLQKAIFSSEY